MATSVRLIRRYVWLIDTIRRGGKMTLEEINRKWMEERGIRLGDEGEIPERTFHRHRQAVADIFGVDIVCSRSEGNVYYIDNVEELSVPSFSSWLFNGLAIENRLMANKDMADRIFFERGLGDAGYLSAIIEAMDKDRVVSIDYLRFNSSAEKHWVVEPYGLKQSDRRWYLIGRRQGSKYLTVLSLDRISSLRMTDETFKRDSSVNVEAYFSDIIGVNMDEDFGVQPVRLRVYGTQRAYIEALPVHSSQRRVAATTEYSDYEFTLRPEYEFQHAVLRMGGDAEVLSPQWLRDDMRWHAREILKRYSEK